MFKVSIIIPAYNCEQYIENCLDSLLRQDISSYEIIVIDDGSDDKSPQILKQYSKNYSFIKVINQENAGQSIARNNGLKEATGEYVQFVDSDDTLEPDCLNNLYETSSANNLDILDFNYCITGDEVKGQYVKETIISDIPRLGKDYFVQYINEYKKFPFPPVWAHFYRREFLVGKNICFFQHDYFEDYLFNANAYLNAERVLYLDRCIYDYSPNPYSTTKSRINPKKIQEFASMSTEISRIAEESGIKIPMDNFFSAYKNAVVQTFKERLWKSYKIYFDKNLFRETTFFLYKPENKLIYLLSKNHFWVFIVYCRVASIKRAIREILSPGRDRNLKGNAIYNNSPTKMY